MKQKPIRARIWRDLSFPERLEKCARSIPAALTCIRSFKNARELIAVYAGLTEMPIPYVVRDRTDSIVLTAREVEDIKTFWGIFCSKIYRIPANPRVALDLGANIGFFSVYLAKRYPVTRIYAVEPVLHAYERLCSTILSNGLEQVVVPIHRAIAGQDGRREILVGTSSVYSSFYQQLAPALKSGRRQSIEAVTLDRLLDELELAEVDFCKMDCEGAEMEALMGASNSALRRIKYITMEYHPWAETVPWPDLLRRLTSMGFECTFHNERANAASFLNKNAFASYSS